MLTNNHTKLIEQVTQALAHYRGERLAVAVSGGADSMVLLWAVAQAFPKERILALTVDHGLRSQAAAEAAMVADWCSGQGTEHLTLQWTGDKPSSGIQAAARAARYRLLAGACNRQGATVLLTAHHADDQAETVLARLARGSGAEGLAAMRPERLIAAGAGAPVALVRPLLSWRRSALRNIAETNDLPIADDPSNDDPTYERVRRRAFLAAAGVQDFLSVDALNRTATSLAETASLQEAQLDDAFRAAGGWVTGSGTVMLSRRRLADLPGGLAYRLLARAIEAAGGSDMPVSPTDVPKGGLEKTITLAGAMCTVDGDDLIIMREPAALNGRADGAGGGAVMPINADTPGRVLWDRRFIVAIPPTARKQSGFSLGPIGFSAPGPVTRTRLASTMPGLWHDGRLFAVPSYAKTMLWHAAAPWNEARADLHVEALTEERLFRRIIRF
ncbi:tRNA lysidine(34) synthetase TilS [Parvularcula flava]|uniref:tRNA(Ile)-lysidine synthase n=1 Tax=Aquisalinus luteolus TaxID=1566827 RepID=A0A8J3A4D2_9PROT|nr:tRNA lysidine(34) synthetase TilS [Aquisalinus luteolus]NHK29307.1 tRNA lysidine(34) synthetase TilS [Aquisalinus luteolus]GGI01176.1 tRNA(Ile)-lysidine synthase [Aquisalinus luteolus]